jgi:predicted dehydrogenase
MKRLSTRRQFLHATMLATTGVWVSGCRTGAPRKISANEKLNLGIIGTANRASQNLAGVAEENIVALCDIDDHFLAAARERFPGAKPYNDFRKLLEQKDVDAVVISTADHTHAVAAAGALKLGKHVYCEKPLTHTVYEARAIARLAAKRPSLATQMGTQIHAGENYRRVVELVECGAIGPVTECHVWCDRSWSGGGRPEATPPVPAHIHWDLWLGPTPMRPYSPEYLPKTWRRWWAFGGGALSDMGCHYMDLAFWALKLKFPLTIEAEGPPVNSETTPAWLIARYTFPARQDLPPVKLTWYDGGRRPPQVQEGKAPAWRNGVLFVGAKGMLIADYSRRRLLPEDQFSGFVAPTPSIPASPGHHAEWIAACKTGSPTTCNFAYGSALTEAVLLGDVAYRSGVRLDWAAGALSATNNAHVSNLVHTEYRKGWQL